MSTPTKKTIIRSTVAGLALLGLTAIPVFAHRHPSETSSTSETTLAQSQTTPTKAQMNQMMERCNSMMGKMETMMNNGNMPGMMNDQNNKPGEGAMNRTMGQ
ncbi:hypothetical protein [Nodularia sp. UHCC 0506]|uniref:hypothetical protein n=1 Tax=Nodularia sp. UHCC 0506 TaxID=3110243 RepID=UPI002B1F2D14|nr:hypothetical protein [Nodularia sp. UHCC 0506]MEA5516226.1 hypothetical protein [Nodularia sp. UHCC 0506]